MKDKDNSSGKNENKNKKGNKKSSASGSKHKNTTTLCEISDIEKRLSDTSKIHETLDDLADLLKRRARENRSTQRMAIQAAAIAADALHKRQDRLQQYLSRTDQKGDYKKYSTFRKCLSLVFGQLYGESRAEKTKANRRIRVVIYLVEQKRVAIKSLAQSVREGGGILAIAKEAANLRAGKPLREKRGGTVSVGDARFTFTFAEMVDAINPDTGNAVLRVKYKLDRHEDLRVVGKAKITPARQKDTLTAVESA